MVSAKAVRRLLLLVLLLGCSSEETDPPLVFEPFMPPPATNPYVDTAFLQEENHAEAVNGGFVAVLLAPHASSPTWIAPRGPASQSGTTWTVDAIDPAAPDVIDAAYLADLLVLATPRSLHLYDGGITQHDAPADTTIHRLVPAPGRLYLLTDRGVGIFTAPDQIDWPTTTVRGITTALETQDTLYLGSTSSISAYARPATTDLGQPLWTLPTTGPIVDFVASVELPQPIDLVAVGDSLVAIDLSTKQTVTVPAFAPDRVPLADPTSAHKTSDGGFLVTTNGGAYRIMDRGIGPEWRVYNHHRWLPDGRVRHAAMDPAVADGPIYFATATGLGRVTASRMTLEEKLVPFVERIVLRHDRDGAIADSRLSVRGDLSTSIPYDSDNDGGWTCYWVLSECFRYLVTGDAEAKAHFDESLDRMLSFRTLTGTEHFLARSVIRKEGCQLDDCDNPDDGEWFTSPDGAWWVKGDTSNDEVTSHMFMMGHAYDLCADDSQKERIRAHVDGVIGGIVDNGYQLIDVDGEVTLHGQFDPFYVNEWISGATGDGGRRSVQMLAALSLAHYMTGKEKFLEAKRELIEEHNYDENVVTESERAFRRGSGDGDELGTQAFYVLLRYESDPERRAQWLEGWRRSYGNMREQQGALWDLVNAVVGGDDPQFENAGRWLRLTPVDFIRWNMQNSHRLDLVAPPPYYKPEGRMRSDGYIIPYDERPMDRWNTNQYKADGGHAGVREMDGADVLMPYWMGRYYGFIVAP